MIKIELVTSSTIVSELVGDDGTTELQKIAVTKPENYHYEGENGQLVFPENEQLTKLAIRFDNITANTATALGNPATASALITAIAGQKWFQGHDNA